jgi:hypothetical protein
VRRRRELFLTRREKQCRFPFVSIKSSSSFFVGLIVPAHNDDDDGKMTPFVCVVDVFLLPACTGGGVFREGTRGAENDRVFFSEDIERRRRVSASVFDHGKLQERKSARCCRS